MSDLLRLFIALELPADVLAALGDMQDQLRRVMPARAMKWTRPEGIHLTLKFLGETPAAKRAAIEAAVRAAVPGHAPIRLRAGGVGCFPNTRRPNVVWVGLRGDLDALAALQRAVEEAVNPLGFQPENRPFSPHLTLARVRREAAAADLAVIGQAVTNAPPGEIAAWTANALSLMESDLQRDGARYTCLLNVPLG